MPESGNAEIVLVYFIGTMGMVILAAGIFLFFITYQKRLLKKQLELNTIKSQQQKEILINTIQAQEKERKRIARDLHDEVGAMLSVIKMNLGRIEKKSANNTTKQVLTETKSYIDDTITQVRRISRALLPPSIERLGLYFAIEELANWINKSGEIKVTCWLGGKQFRFDSKKELAVFRIIQELINNSLKHAEASKIELNTNFRENKLVIVVADNGNGFDLNKKNNAGLGLKNLESRSEILGAKFKIKSVINKGTTAILILNMPAAV